MASVNNVYDFISNQLTLGNIKRSDRITEQYLVDNLGISRTPVREALVKLTADGILEHVPRKGYKVKSYNKKDVQELYTLIGVLDGKIAEMSCKKLDNKDFSLMKFLTESMNSAISNQLYTKYNELQSQFHDVYMNKCNNKIMVKELQNKKDIFIGKNYMHMGPESINNHLSSANEEHKKLLDLFMKRESRKVRDYLENVHWNPKQAQYDIW
ncbi:GntR family transcriptional regulator [Limosilactobacillus vaginalis]|uniref:GntR family transcriptional regulator n=1 Tax=Limosilactobacillus vaginalis TaxID=1633 RepID=UPI00241C0AEA|nr:GntR family transcriptional regulator [Limosilactobacillus vaginalis]